MLPTRFIRTTGGWELLWWATVLALAGALLLLSMSPIAGAAPAEGRLPGLVPELREPWAEAIATYRSGDFATAANQFEMLACRSAAEGMADDLADGGLPLWATLAAQATGDWETAVAGWNRATLALDAEVYRYLALTQLYLQHGREDLAGELLDAAWHVAPDHPLVHYYTGVFNLQWADDCHDWYDAGTVRPMQLVTLQRPVVTPNTRATARLMATAELERAIARADEINRQQPLVPIGWTADVALLPTVGDLLCALHAEHFVPETHHTLATLYLDRGQLELAQEHLDAAARMGQPIPYAYGELARQFEQQGRHLNAAQAYANQLRVGVKDVRTVEKLWRNMRRAIATDLLR